VWLVQQLPHCLGGSPDHATRRLQPQWSLHLAILAHWLTGEIILFFLGIAELFGIA
jgi:hypothetical protein